MINQDLKNYGKTKTFELSERASIVLSFIGAAGIGIILALGV